MARNRDDAVATSQNNCSVSGPSCWKKVGWPGRRAGGDDDVGVDRGDAISGG